MSVEWMGLGFAYLNGTEVKWRIFLGLQLLCAIVMLVGSFWMPESPRWLVAHGKHETAHAVLKKLHAPSRKERKAARDTEAESSEDEVPLWKREFHQIEAQIQHEREIEHLGIGAILKRPSYRKRLYLILFFFFFQQATGKFHSVAI
jgi:hypothetical protein